MARKTARKPVKKEEPTPEPVVEEPAEPVVEEATEPVVKQAVPQKTQLEKLESMATLNAYDILTRVCLKMNQYFVTNSFSIEEVSPATDANHPETAVYNVIGHFMNNKVTLNAVSGFRMYNKQIASDLLLKKIYGRSWTILHDHGDVKGQLSEDPDWYVEKKAVQITRNDKMIAMQCKRFENQPESKEVTAKMDKIKSKHSLSEVVPDVQGVMDAVENCYWTPLVATCIRYDLEKEVVYTKFKNNKEVKFDFDTVTDFTKLEQAKNIMYKVRIDLSKEGIESLAYEAESKNICAARSTASLHCLKQLLEEGTIAVFSKNTNEAHKKKKSEKKNNRIREEQLRVKAKEQKKKDNIKKQDDIVKAAADKKAEKLKAHLERQPGKKVKVEAEGDAQPGQKKMMPCIMGPDGRYYMLAPGQGVPNGNAQENGTGSGASKKKKRNKKKAAQPEDGESPAKVVKTT